MDKYLQSLVAAPLANPLKINGDPANLNGGKPYPAPRARKPPTTPHPNDLTRKQLRERKEKEHNAKLEMLYAYYATTDKDAATVAQHMGVFRLDQTVVDKETGKPIHTKTLDVERVEAQLKWRREAAAKA